MDMIQPVLPRADCENSLATKVSLLLAVTEAPTLLAAARAWPAVKPNSVQMCAGSSMPQSDMNKSGTSAFYSGLSRYFVTALLLGSPPYTHS